MMNWIVILLLIAFIAGIYMYFKERINSNRIRIRVLIFIFLFAILFLLISGYMIVKKNNIDISTGTGLMKVAKVYLVWMGNSVSNFKSISANAVKMDWNPVINVTG